MMAGGFVSGISPYSNGTSYIGSLHVDNYLVSAILGSFEMRLKFG